jgi:hypothetical protein
MPAASGFGVRLLGAAVLATAAAAPVAALGQPATAPPPSELRLVGLEEIRAAMAPEAEAGYDLTATTNQVRFHAAVLLALVREARARDPLGPPLLIPPEPWFEAYLEVCGLERDQAPVFAELSLRYRQWRMVEYRVGRVLRRMVEGPEPELALGVRLFWPEQGEPGSKFSFRDELSVPRLAVTNHRQISYCLLVYPGMLVFDEIEGLTGRPTSGGLALLFELIGEGRIVWSRQAISPSGLQLTRTRASKGFFGKTATITVRPDGTAFRGFEQGAEAELAPIEERLLRPVAALYYGVPGPPPAQRLAELQGLESR